MPRFLILAACCTFLSAGFTTGAQAADAKKVVFVAGPRSHGYGSHEHNAGCKLLAQCLQEAVPGVQTVVCQNGWPQDSQAFENADAIVLFADGGGRNPIIPHLDEVQKLTDRGVGLVCIHYAVEMPKGPQGDAFKDMLGGYFETFWSVNPHWNAQFTAIPDHPVARGVKPFEIEDEWYYHMRFRDNMKDVTPILSAVPPESTRQRPDGAHSGNATVRKRSGMQEHVAWTCERPGKGRGFGFTGGHWHWNWANDQFRKVVLNGIAWTAGIEVPPDGLRSTTPSFAQLEANLDEQPTAKFSKDEWIKKIQSWNQP